MQVIPIDSSMKQNPEVPDDETPEVNMSKIAEITNELTREALEFLKNVDDIGFNIINPLRAGSSSYFINVI